MFLSVPEVKKLERRDSEDIQSDSTNDCYSPKKNTHKKFESQSERKKYVKEYKRKQKTEMCNNWELRGWCQWKDKCSYAHGEQELVKKTHMPKKFMTKACDQFHQ